MTKHASCFLIVFYSSRFETKIFLYILYCEGPEFCQYFPRLIRPRFDSDTPNTVYQARGSKYHYSSTAVANDTYLGQTRTNGVAAHTISEPYQPPSAPTNLSVRGNQNFLGADPGIRPSFRLGSLAEQPFVRMRITQWTAFSDHDESGWISITAVPSEPLSTLGPEVWP
ncbi:uncharacterized protein BT62DRAFT_1080747 [Guyanagaster necrorhizus]|uniref:Uncharacterized protein n=1 Tax=Guyanagaster necrorhizus TaxID=856835 RepID=A0A9P7VIF3_9AGAR|nr:uncharacterized protein BT62DRAFT_1080747 [Guyanagaster necrorhizus MCA 3950]KAG7440621.1 hypothetical protein BT62DRAFT_1080747 [Guyanagaster necrorhizus MCA 3950]